MFSNSLTNFEEVVHAMTGNGSYINLLKLAWKITIMNLLKVIRLLPLRNKRLDAKKNHEIENLMKSTFK